MSGITSRISVYLHTPGVYDEFNKAIINTLYITVPLDEGEEEDDYNTEDFILNGKLKLEVNKAGTFDFDILPSHSCYEALRRYIHYIRVDEDNETIFYGRIMSISMDFSGLKHVTCEGLMANLTDCPMYNALAKQSKNKNISENILKFKGEYVAWDLVIEALRAYRNLARTDIVFDPRGTDASEFRWLFDDKLGGIDISGSVGDFIISTVIENVGGILYMSYVKQSNDDILGELHLIPDPAMWKSRLHVDLYTKAINQTIEFGENLIDLSAEYDSDDVKSAIGVKWQKGSNDIPDDDDDDESSSDEGSSSTDDSSSSGSQCLFAYATDVDSGRSIVIPVMYGMSGLYMVGGEIKSFNALDEESASRTASKYADTYCDYDFGTEPFDSLSIKAIDLHYFSNGNYEKINYLDYVRIVSPAHGIDKYMFCSSVEIDLDNPANNSYTFVDYKLKEPSDEKYLSRRLNKYT